MGFQLQRRLQNLSVCYLLTHTPITTTAVCWSKHTYHESNPEQQLRQPKHNNSIIISYDTIPLYHFYRKNQTRAHERIKKGGSIRRLSPLARTRRHRASVLQAHSMTQDNTPTRNPLDFGRTEHMQDTYTKYC